MLYPHDFRLTDISRYDMANLKKTRDNHLKSSMSIIASNPRGDAMLYACVAVGAAVTIAILLRMVARRRSKAAFTIDDWLIVASLIPTSGMLVCGGSS